MSQETKLARIWIVVMLQTCRHVDTLVVFIYFYIWVETTAEVWHGPVTPQCKWTGSWWRTDITRCERYIINTYIVEV